MYHLKVLECFWSHWYLRMNQQHTHVYNSIYDAHVVYKCVMTMLYTWLTNFPLFLVPK